jgi:hypothetical protein
VPLGRITARRRNGPIRDEGAALPRDSIYRCIHFNSATLHVPTEPGSTPRGAGATAA